MSEVRVNNIVDYGGKGAPTFDNGAVISGVSSLGNQAKIGTNVTITSGGINVSGVTTAATLSGNLTGDVKAGFLTATSTVIGSGVTINAGGLNITGVMTATTFEGSGASLSGVGMTITPLAYNPDVSDSTVPKATGIGITFDHRILAGSGNVTLSIATNAGAAGTTVENFGVGSSVTIQGRKAIIDPTSDLTAGDTYHISYPSGAFTNTHGDVSYVGTAYTFGVKPTFTSLWTWGHNAEGELGQNNTTWYSSPVQVPGENWQNLGIGDDFVQATKSDGTMWAWGENAYGHLGQNDTVYRSSPVQVGSDTTWTQAIGGGNFSVALKSDNTLWMWGQNHAGALGQNSPDNSHVSSPVQVPGTWSIAMGGMNMVSGVKTDGTLWVWGNNNDGKLGLSSPQSFSCSSPTQVPGTTWGTTRGKLSHTEHGSFAIRTDGTLWAWGSTGAGALGLNAQGNPAKRSSPVQVGSDTTWNIIASGNYSSAAIKTDGTLWTWGKNDSGQLGQNSGGGGGTGHEGFSSPVQIPGTNWANVCDIYQGFLATKTDGRLYVWGKNQYGELGQNNITFRSSPTQLPGTTWNLEDIGGRGNKRNGGNAFRVD